MVIVRLILPQKSATTEVGTMEMAVIKIVNWNVGMEYWIFLKSVMRETEIQEMVVMKIAFWSAEMEMLMKIKSAMMVTLKRGMDATLSAR